MNLKVRRNINYLERLLDNALENTYVCDYLDEDSFFQGIELIIHEFWNFGSDKILDTLEWEYVQELLDNYFDEIIRNYYNEHKEGCEKSDELTEYPNFVYESVDDLLSDEELTPYAVFEITKPLAYMPIEYYYQEAPLWKTEKSIIYIKKGSSGHKSISTKNIKVLKVFPEGETEELHNYLERLRSKVR
jgi:hypothetical protein